MSGVMLWLAQGFGVGRIPFAPGTFGSVLGFLWFLLLLRSGNFWLYLAGLVLGVVLSIWLCGVAEKILDRTDPGSVVLDEIVAMPLCFVAWVASDWFSTGHLPVAESFFSAPNWRSTLLIFLLFRFFDILKPWPVRQSQNLAGGWGVTVDDLLAAVYVSALSLLFIR
jgi:phosphatidylglycerophosphatase A